MTRYEWEVEFFSAKDDSLRCVVAIRKSSAMGTDFIHFRYTGRNTWQRITSGGPEISVEHAIRPAFEAYLAREVLSEGDVLQDELGRYA